MANVRGQSIDMTHLSADTAEERQIIHRDLISHCLRWTHVAKFAHKNNRFKTDHILDIGCGVDLPLAKMFYTNKMSVAGYVGVDYNKPDRFDMETFHTGRMQVNAFGNVDFAKNVQISEDRSSYHLVNSKKEHLTEDFELPTIVVCFEMLEHVEPGHCRAVLKKILELLKASEVYGKDPHAFISTPCYDAHTGAAGNHVSEIKHQALGALIEDLGFEIEGRWGTFASQKDYRDIFIEEFEDGEEIWSRLSEYYDSNYLATILAPLYPTRARNCLWRLKPVKASYVRRYPPLLEVPGPWTSSERWEELASDEAYNG